MDRLGGCVTEGSGPKPPTQGTMARTMPVSRTGKGTNGETSWLRSRVLNLVTLIALAQVIPTVRGGDISCQGMRYVYFNKGLDTSDIPRSPQQGEQKFPMTFFAQKGAADNTAWDILVSRYLLSWLCPVSPISHEKWWLWQLTDSLRYRPISLDGVPWPHRWNMACEPAIWNLWFIQKAKSVGACLLTILQSITSFKSSGLIVFIPTSLEHDPPLFEKIDLKFFSLIFPNHKYISGLFEKLVLTGAEVGGWWYSAYNLSTFNGKLSVNFDTFRFCFCELWKIIWIEKIREILLVNLHLLY